jgi:hypothetical protein
LLFGFLPEELLLQPTILTAEMFVLLLQNGNSLDRAGMHALPITNLLPQFARERLYTYPLPSQPGDPMMDCHWSTLNFFNETPDNRFADPNYTVPYLKDHYYQVAKATRYGDLIFLLDGKGNAIHSAVYIADDIVFTKNGNNYMEPWMLMRLKNLLANYSVLGNSGLAVYRIAEPLIVCTRAQTPEAIFAPKTIGADDLEQCREIGATLAAGLALGIY